MKQKFRFFKHSQWKIVGAISVLFGLLMLVVCLSACGMGNNPNGNGAKRPDLFVPDEGKLPSEAEREAISEADILGEYQGSTLVEMDGEQYGPYTETVKIGRQASGDLYFTSVKTVYENMPVDIGYEFVKDGLSHDKKFMLTAAPEGKSFSFEAEKGNLLFYTKRSETFESVPSKTSMSGFIYKKGGKVYIGFRVVYDTEATRKTFPTIPENSHKSMSSAMKNGEKIK